MNKEKKIENYYLLYLVGIISSIVISFSRRPDAFLNPQFWAEDGKMWYQQAYSSGFFYSLLKTEAGYFQTFPRLIAGFSQIFPFDYAPLIFNLSALAAKILVVCFLLSPRIEKLLPNLWWRGLAAFIYLGIPHSYETHGNLTNVQWHLALLSCLIIISLPAKTSLGKVFDICVISIFAVSGPFCLLLFPLAVLKYWFTKERHTLILVSIILVGCFIQGLSLLSKDRLNVSNGANIKLFLNILGGHLFASSIIGENGNVWLHINFLWNRILLIAVNTIGGSLLIYAWIQSKLELRMLMTFSFLVTASAFISPVITEEMPQWIAMNYPSIGSRYWLIPIFCFFMILFWLAQNSVNKFVKYFSIGLIMLSSIGVIWDWQHPPYKNLDFPKHVTEFNNANSGEEVTIPINPDWEMKLLKK